MSTEFTHVGRIRGIRADIRSSRRHPYRRAATLISTLPIVGEIILISAFANRIDLGRITVVQLMTAGILGFATMPFTGETVPALSWVWVAAGAGLGAASCLIQLTMNWAQKSVSATRATIIYAGEPVWAAAIGRIAGERLPAAALLGGMLVVLGILASELRIVRRPRTRD